MRTIAPMIVPIPEGVTGEASEVVGGVTGEVDGTTVTVTDMVTKGTEYEVLHTGADEVDPEVPRVDTGAGET